MTLREVLERLKSLDEVTLMELLSVTSEDLVDAFKEKKFICGLKWEDHGVRRELWAIESLLLVYTHSVREDRELELVSINVLAEMVAQIKHQAEIQDIDGKRTFLSEEEAIVPLS